MELMINGEKRALTNVGTVAELLTSFKLDQKILVVELNHTIVDKAGYAEALLQDGDRLEIVHFVGGG